MNTTCYRGEKCDVRKIQICKIMGLVGVFRKNRKKKPLAKNQPVRVQIGEEIQAPQCSDDSIQTPSKICWDRNVNDILMDFYGVIGA